MTLFESLHFNRPEWLWLIPIVAVLAMLFTLNSASTQLKKMVAPHLIPFLTSEHNSSKANRWLGLLCISLFIIGLAGISFTQERTELYNSTHKTVFIVDQSLSLYATDVRPNRLTKAKQLLRDIVNHIEGEFALVAFAGDAYVISPFTQDKETLTHFLVALDPIIMPLYGSRLATGLERALSLLKATDSDSNLVILTDDITDADAAYLRTHIVNKDITVDVLSVGTETGGAVVLPNGETLRRNNLPVVPSTPVAKIISLFEEVGGNVYTHRASGSDIAKIGRSNRHIDNAKRTQISGITWQEQGHWLALPFLIWLLWQFKTRAIVCFVIVWPLIPQSADASPLDWFKTKDQQAQDAVNEGDWQLAANLFENPYWRAASLYATQDYENAANLLATIADSPEDLYNLANAKALSGDVGTAIKAYEQALELKPDFKEAHENLAYLKQQRSTPPQDKEDQSDKEPSPSSGKPQSPQGKNEQSQQSQDNHQKNQDNQNDSDQHSNQEAMPSSAAQEDQQALDQWLRQIQDDPGTLLQRKLWYLHQERRNENRYNEEEGIQPW